MTQNGEQKVQLPATGREWEWETVLGIVKLSFETVRKYFCPKATEQEAMHFMAVCKYHNLNPWLREAYLIKYEDNEPAQIAIGRDAHAIRAEEHPQYAGAMGGIIVQTADGKIEEREGEFWLDPEKLLGGWALVYRKDREQPITHKIRLQDWIQTKRDGTPVKFWRLQAAHMIAKVAMSQGQHAAFPRKYQGLISEDEIAGPLPRVEIAVQEPRSLAEAAASPPETPPPTPPITPEPTGPVIGGEIVPPDRRAITPAEAEAIRKQEVAEVAQPAVPQMPSVQAPMSRDQLWNKLKERFGGTMGANKWLHTTFHKLSLSALDDGEVLEAVKKLG